VPPTLPAELRRRDPAFIRRLFPLLAWLVDRYYRTEVEGIENLVDGKFLGVATHNGGMTTPDLYGLLVAFWRRFGIETPGYGMMHKMGFAVPGFGSFMARLGALPASRTSAELALGAGFPILCCPGGDLDALKPFRDRHRIVFGERRGFIRIAIEQQVPIVPVVSVGAHETILILNDGRRLAELCGATRLRIKTIPLALSFPFGLTPAGVGAIPLPSKIRVRVLPKIELGEPPRAAADPGIVERCFEHVCHAMQRALDELAARRRRWLLG
jgi:1-acyl-sn-glycerol-3-phosphate acyltransferase